MKEKSIEITLPENAIAYKLNSGQIGFYRVLYTDDNLENLGKLVLEKRLSHLDIYGLQNDMMAFVLQGSYSINLYLDYLHKYYINEENYLSLIEIAANLSAFHFFLDSKRERIAIIGRDMFERALEKIGFEPNEGENLRVSRLRSALLWSAFKYGSKKVLEFIKQKYEDFKKDIPIHADLLSTVYRAIAAYDKNSKDLFFKKLTDPKTTGQELRFLLQAVSEVRDEVTLKEIFDITLEKVPMNNRYVPFVLAARNETTKSWLWDWYKEHAEILKEKITPHDIGRILIAIASRSGIGKEEDVGVVFEKLAEKNPKLEDDIKLALEMMKVYSTAIYRN